MYRKLRSSLLPFSAVLFFSALLWRGYPHRIEVLHREYRVASAPPLADLNPAFIAVATLGNKAIYDDFINIWLLQTLVDSRKASSADDLMQSIRAVIRHHPRLETLYMLSCFTMYIDYKRPDFCQEIVLAGLKAFPESWRLPMTQAYVHYFLLKEPAQAASFFMMAASRPRSPPYVKNLVQKLLKENELNPVDVERSMEIMSGDRAGDQFLKMLKAFGKIADPGVASPGSAQ